MRPHGRDIAPLLVMLIVFASGEIPKPNPQSCAVLRFLNNTSMWPECFCSTHSSAYKSVLNFRYSQGELQAGPLAPLEGEPGSPPLIIDQEYEWGALYTWIDVITSDHV